MKQYFFLVAVIYNDSTFPEKIFLNQDQAENYAKELAKELADEIDGYSHKVQIFRQGTGKLEKLDFFKTYYLGISDTEVGGSDFDIDKGRWS